MYSSVKLLAGNTVSMSTLLFAVASSYNIVKYFQYNKANISVISTVLSSNKSSRIIATAKVVSQKAMVEMSP